MRPSTDKCKTTYNKGIEELLKVETIVRLINSTQIGRFAHGTKTPVLLMSKARRLKEWKPFANGRKRRPSEEGHREDAKETGEKL